MTSSLSRRRLLGQALATVGGAFLMSRPVSAYAVTAGSLLPSVGQTVTVNLRGFGAALATDTLPPPHPKLDFVGAMTQKVLEGGTDFVHLQTLDFVLRAQHPLFGGLTLRLPDSDATPLSTVKAAEDGLVETWFQSFTFTAEKQGDMEGPFTYDTLEPGRWEAHLSSYPPPPWSSDPDGAPTGGALFQLQAPISLGTMEPNGEKTTYGQLQEMHINQGQAS